jgi:hypothetical protein
MMFAMKKGILAVAFILVICGYAAAQSTSEKSATKKEEKATVKKGPAAKINNDKKTVLKQEASANAKSDSTVRLILPVDKTPVDSAVVPKVKHDY